VASLQGMINDLVQRSDKALGSESQEKARLSTQYNRDLARLISAAENFPELHSAQLQTIRKHRLWEVFLVDKLHFAWDEVHEVAEQLEHIQSPLLIERLDAYLNYPKFDPHGDPIPDAYGDVRTRPRCALNEMDIDQSGQIVAVKDSSAAFLRYLDKVGAYIGARIKILDKVEFDGSIEILVDQKKTLFMSKDVASNILVLQS